MNYFVSILIICVRGNTICEPNIHNCTLLWVQVNELYTANGTSILWLNCLRKQIHVYLIDNFTCILVQCV